ncbi:tripartite-type tricarboxylate transporter receptor subunit TctC [Humitalea rosea]|uniref:Tripartite-type tricarboxylate transporter receptor subunit TctC n=1 Tax=Humitalea rosea TaxID=990373 RepID=A0A2W7I9J4_9PROT|nr:tripartite tricarboxylate transporter substrate binding protein [Humitalea rosea]PZW43561.1 tripartite-type tricarboxylate transporter receptor subunit TctC [Humitalea rosea]
MSLTKAITGRRALAAAALAGLAAPRLARAAAWPADRTIEVIIPFPPGGGVDQMARPILVFVANYLPGARFAVINRPGAAGQLGFEANFNANPDGYTIGAVTNTAMNTVAIERNPRYRADQFSWIANVVDDPGGFWVRPDSALKSLADLKAAALRAPDTISVGTAGIGSDDHLLQLAFEQAAGVRLSHVPYAGTAPVLRDLLGGTLNIGSLNMSEGLPLMKDGRIRCLAQGGPERWAPAAEVPTFRDQGFDALGGSARGIAGPPGMPAEIVARLREAFAKALADPAYIALAAQQNIPLRPLIGDAYRDMMLADQAQLRALWAIRPWRE